MLYSRGPIGYSAWAAPSRMRGRVGRGQARAQGADEGKAGGE
jgi:hypothetical protein